MGEPMNVLLFLLGVIVTGSHESSTPGDQNYTSHVPENARNQILYQFNVVDGLLDTLVIGNDRTSASFPFRNRTECTVSQDELVGLRDHIKDIMANVSTQRAKCDFTPGADNCENWLKLIQCGLEDLGNEFKNKIAGASAGEVSKWKNAYQGLMDQYQKDIDIVKSSLSDEFKQKIDELNTQLQNLGNIINETQEKLKTALIKLCVSEIGNGKTARALSIFKDIDDDSKLKVITKTAYEEYGRLANVNNIIGFVKSLRTCAQDRLAYTGIYEAMKEHNEFTKPYVIDLYDALRPCMCKSDIRKDLEKYIK